MQIKLYFLPNSIGAACTSRKHDKKERLRKERERWKRKRGRELLFVFFQFSEILLIRVRHVVAVLPPKIFPEKIFPKF